MNSKFSLNDSRHLDRLPKPARKFLRKIRRMLALERPRRPKFQHVYLSYVTILDRLAEQLAKMPLPAPQRAAHGLTEREPSRLVRGPIFDLVRSWGPSRSLALPSVTSQPAVRDGD